MKNIFKLTLASSLLMASLSVFAFEGSIQQTNVEMGNTTFNITLLPSAIVSSFDMSIDGQLFAPVESDAIDFLASGEKTDALDSFLTELRLANPKLDQVQDREILQAIISAQ